MFKLIGVDSATLESLNHELLDWISDLPECFALFILLTTPLLPWILAADANEIE